MTERFVVVAAVLTVSAAALAAWPQAQGPAPGTAWTPKDVMDQRIDVAAQHALFRMLKGSPAQRVAASEILTAVKSGSLLGIYQEDQQVPAMRAQGLGQWWGQILPKGTDGTCMVEPVARPPVIAMRRGIQANPVRYDAVLAAAWAECAITVNQPVRAYDPSAPGDPPATGPSRECRGAAQLAAALQECQDLANQRLAYCEAKRAREETKYAKQQAKGVQGTPPSLDVEKCAAKVSAFVAVCQQTAHAACR